MDSGTASGVMTAILILLFIGIVIWAYSSRRRRDFDEAARIPLEDENPSNDQASSNDKEDSKGNTQ